MRLTTTAFPLEVIERLSLTLSPLLDAANDDRIHLGNHQTTFIYSLFSTRPRNTYISAPQTLNHTSTHNKPRLGTPCSSLEGGDVAYTI